MRIVVVGAGIGGLVTALAGHRAGHRITVVERSAAGSAAGAGISLFGNALRALDTIPSRDVVDVADRAGSTIPGVAAARHRAGPNGGPPGTGGPTAGSIDTSDSVDTAVSGRTVGDRVRAIGGTPAVGTPIGLRTPDGRWLARSVTAAHGRIGGNAEGLVVHRGDLQRALLAELPPDVISTGSTVLRVESPTGPARVTWAGPSGRTTVEADLVVAADGINSRVRRQCWPGHPGPRYAGYTSWRGVTSGPIPLDAAGETWGRGERFGYAPLRDGRVYWFATASVPAATAFPDERAEVLARFGGWHDPIRALIRATEPHRVLRHDICDLARPLATFAAGRVVLVGDSAHAMTPDLGQGGCQAMEDAVTLIAALGRDHTPDHVPDDHSLAVALAGYDVRRRRRTQALARRARRLGRIGQLRFASVAVSRDALLRMVPDRMILDASAAIQRWDPPLLS